MKKTPSSPVQTPRPPSIEEIATQISPQSFEIRKTSATKRTKPKSPSIESDPGPAEKKATPSKPPAEKATPAKPMSRSRTPKHQKLIETSLNEYTGCSRKSSGPPDNTIAILRVPLERPISQMLTWLRSIFSIEAYDWLTHDKTYELHILLHPSLLGIGTDGLKQLNNARFTYLHNIDNTPCPM